MLQLYRPSRVLVPRNVSEAREALGEWYGVRSTEVLINGLLCHWR